MVEKAKLQKLLEFQDVFQNKPGRTNLTEHSINTDQHHQADNPLIVYHLPIAALCNRS